ncbi:FG-GAP-like repeat-containing protein [Planktothrix agardhii]|uniref:FG-GAP-like repeat-containing protein n=1 Tax=Planktothrix agardhii TaxID=1160 RepID=UPI0020B31155|nr:FG-GAP-like repeat-containing protein [Planktothrix agardhii]CAD5914344.1 Extracellular matrix protein 3 [Planktothrix agardhii]
MENNQKPFNLPFSQNLPIILIGNLSVEPLRAAGIIEEALTLVEDKLTEFIASPTLATDLQTVFGQSTDIPWARTLLDGLPVSDELPQITLVSAELMNGAVGGFDSLTGTVYLADSLIDPNSVITSDTEPSPHLVNVIIEELGHWLDSRLNQVDTPGDEGELLAALVQGDGLSASEIARLRSETDQVVVTLEDQTVILEASEPSFTKDTSISLPGVYWGSVAWADYNGDGKPDFLLTGYDNSNNPISKLYKNTGSGFSEDTSVSLPGVSASSVAWADYNGDGKPDLLLTGWDGSDYISKLYKNTGSGFSEDTSVSLPGVSVGSVAWADYNGDGKQDFLLTGFDSYSSETISNKISKLYKNTGSGFIEDTRVSLPGVGRSSVAWADYNGDGKPDLLLTGEDNSYNQISKLYKNTGSGFIEDTTVSLPGVGYSSVAWADYNGDGKQDFLLTGYDGSGYISKLYKNTGNGFTEDTRVSLPGVHWSFVAWADYNGDSKPDFLLTGYDSYSLGTKISKLYKNTGRGFIEDTSVYLPGVGWSSVAWSDYNGDGKPDFLLTGKDNSDNYISKLYKNTTPTIIAQISIKDTQIIEGDNGKKLAKFTVSLNTPSTQTVTVNYATTNDTAKAGEDYKRTNGKLTFKPGETRKTVNVPVFGDTKLEANETFKLLLSQPKNAKLGKKQAIGSITNDDLTKISIKDTQIIEGDDGKKQAKFTVSLNTKVNQKVEVSYATSDGTAKVGEDYQRTNGKLTFQPNQTQKTIIVPILGDTLDEDNETFFLNLSKPKNADLGDKSAIGKITDNDTGGDKPGDSFKTPVNLGKVKQEIVKNDHIGFTEGGVRDTDDYYRLQLDRKGTLVLVLDGLFKDANIDLYGSEQELISQSNEKGISSEIIQQQLDPGTYYVRVYPQDSARTNYRLSIDLI